MIFKTLTVDSQPVFTVVDLTDSIRRWVSGRDEGLCNVFLPHGTAGLAIMEMNPKIERDVRTALDLALPRDDTLWANVHHQPGHAADHIVPMFTSASVTIPVRGGELMLGLWQSIVLIDPNIVKSARDVHLTLLEDRGDVPDIAGVLAHQLGRGDGE